MTKPSFRLKWPGGDLLLDRCRIMGILNVTPDSFSDGGRFLRSESAVERAWAMAEEGADLLDVGAESSRPGAEPVPFEEERERLEKVLIKLKAERFLLPISLDTCKPEIAEWALGEGLVQIVNDIEGGRNPKMVEVVARQKVPYIMMHMFGHPRSMQQDFHYEDVVQDLVQYFERQLRELLSLEQVIVDPGIGFGKSVDHNLQILKRLKEFSVLGCPVLVGASRKSFIGKVAGGEPDDRLEGSLAAVSAAWSEGAHIVRVHDVKSTKRFLSVLSAIAEGELPSTSPCT